MEKKVRDGRAKTLVQGEGYGPLGFIYRGSPTHEKGTRHKHFFECPKCGARRTATMGIIEAHNVTCGSCSAHWTDNVSIDEQARISYITLLRKLFDRGYTGYANFGAKGYTLDPVWDDYDEFKEWYIERRELLSADDTVHYHNLSILAVDPLNNKEIGPLTAELVTQSILLSHFSETQLAPRGYRFIIDGSNVYAWQFKHGVLRRLFKESTLAAAYERVTEIDERTEYVTLSVEEFRRRFTFVSLKSVTQAINIFHRTGKESRAFQPAINYFLNEVLSADLRERLLFVETMKMGKVIISLRGNDATD